MGQASNTLRRAPRLLLALVVLTFSGAAVFAQPIVPPGVTISQRGDGWGFATDKGLTLYFNDLMRQSLAACAGDCAQRWKPFIAPPEAKPFGDWTLVDNPPLPKPGAAKAPEQKPGEPKPSIPKVWAYKGDPLFTSVLDRPGTVYADNDRIVIGIAGASWRVAYEPMQTPPGVTMRAALPIRVLADNAGMTLYTYDRDGKDRSNCKKPCTDSWLPLSAPSRAQAQGAWSAIVRDDGTKQWAHKGRPLYTYKWDAKPGEKRGDGVDRVWHAAMVRPAPRQPAAIGIQDSPLGPIFTDARGLALYAYFDTPERLHRKCNEDCMAANWRPALVPPGAQPLDFWNTITLSNGTKQWTYQGRPLFTYALDESPGEISGDLFGYGGDLSEGAWKPIQLESPS
jgi:predicted lipoprotein with Yx(FWY)xxD motif